MPTSRSEGDPLAQALAAFLGGLERADALMPAWRSPRTERVWLSCADAIGAARAEAERLRDGGEALGFEALNARLSDVISPLEEFADAAEIVRRN